MSEKRSNRPAEYLSLPVKFDEHILLKPIVRELGDRGLMFAIKMCCFLAQQRGFEYEHNKDALKDIAEYFEYKEKDFNKLFEFAVSRRFFTIEFIEEKEYFRCRFLEEVLLNRLFKRRDQKLSSKKKQKDTKEQPDQEEVGPAGPGE